MALAEGTPANPGQGSLPVPLTLGGKTEPVTPSGDDRPVLPVKIWPAGVIVLSGGES